MNILCVDDESVSLRLLQRACESANPGGEVRTARSAWEAESQLAGVDILITDLVMPGRSGLELLEQAKKFHPGIEVLVVTAHASVSSAIAAMKQGARDYLPKPLDTDLICKKVNSIRELLEARREADQNFEARSVLERDMATTLRTFEDIVEAQRHVLSEIGAVLSRDDSSDAKLAAICTCLTAAKHGPHTV